MNLLPGTHVVGGSAEEHPVINGGVSGWTKRILLALTHPLLRFLRPFPDVRPWIRTRQASRAQSRHGYGDLLLPTFPRFQ